MEIRVENVCKNFNKIEVLNNINLTLKSGKIYGFIGRNGSGKSVFLKLLCGFYKPSSGDIFYNDMSIVTNGIFPPETRALIEKPEFLPELTGFENLKLLASIQNKISDKEIIETLEKVSLINEKNKKFCKYSLGTKQKLGIAQVLMENPEVLILDEPLNGIESSTAIKIRDILKEEKEKGKLIIIASHIKEDVELLADEIYLFDNGTISKL